MSKRRRRVFTAQEEQLLRERFADTCTAELAAQMERPYTSVASKARQLGLRKSAAFLASAQSGRLDGIKGMHTRFKRGNKPWNTGKPGSCGRHPNSAAHHFKGGSLNGFAAAHYMPVGALRIGTDGTLQRKVTDLPVPPNERWIPVHRLVWEAVHGPVPAGHIVVFKHGRRTTELDEITEDAVELITRAENMRRNSIHTRLPAELARVAQLRGALKRAINTQAAKASNPKPNPKEPT